MCGVTGHDSIYTVAVRDVCEEERGEGSMARYRRVRGCESSPEIVYGPGERREGGRRLGRGR